MLKYSSSREEVLSAVQFIVKIKGKNEFSIREVVDYMIKEKTSYSESTIRTDITSRCCVNAPNNHAIVYDYFERIGRGKYRLLQV